MIRHGIVCALRAAAAMLAAALLLACGGGGGDTPATAGVAVGTLRVHYARTDGAYGGWGMYSWSGPRTPSGAWPDVGRFLFASSDGYGAYVDIVVDASKAKLDFLVTRPNAAGTDAEKDCSADRSVAFAADIAARGQETWLKTNDCGVYATLAAASAVGIQHARALWLSAAVIAWPGVGSNGQFKLYHAAQGGMAVDANGADTGADGAYDLSASSGLSGSLATRYKTLASATALALPAAAQADLKRLLKGQLLVVNSNAGKVTSGTQMQVQAVLDDTYAATAAQRTLGLSFAADGTPTLRLWAPTAQSVSLRSGGVDYAMTEDTASGVWSASGNKTWRNTAYYTYTLRVFSRTDGASVNTYTVTDPYAVTLDADVFGGAQQQAMVADLGSAELQPAGWATHATPALAAAQDIVLYELHVRDFSVNDATLAKLAYRGKYKAFSDSASNGSKHLRALAAAGLTHVHLLPTYDLASVTESGCTTPSISDTDAVSSAQQASVAATRDTDCFNWGYDPKHYGAPDGAFATDAADGRVRVLEFREMVAALHGAGLRVVLDVVYNHTAGNFLDRIVPGYYYRLNGDGVIETSSCCQNTAPEFAMMEKLMIDTLKTWAVQYRVDGFRFDIMGHIPKAAMLKARADVDAAAGRALYYYGEAWNFGEVQDDRLFVQARQANMAGTGIGSFNDRMRDALRGGGPFDSGADLVKNQGFASGLCYDLNAQSGCDSGNLEYRQNLIRLGMSGNLAGFVLNGKPGSAYDYGGQQAGFTQDPPEIVNYAGVHDGETLWDISQYKHPAGVSSADRARAQVVALGSVLLGQGIPFLHAGDELLRSKSMDRDSYNAGDWFNRIDWSGANNYFGQSGLPSAEKNAGNWDVMKPILQNPNALPSAADIAFSREAVKDLLRVRKSTSMLRLATGAEVINCVSFPDQAAQQPGLIVMKVGKGDASCGDGRYKNVIVLVNANKAAQSFGIATLAGKAVSLHPVLAAGSDPQVRNASFNGRTGEFSVPGRSVAVFVQN